MPNASEVKSDDFKIENLKAIIKAKNPKCQKCVKCNWFK